MATSAAPIRRRGALSVVVVDRSADLRRALGEILTAEPDQEVVGAECDVDAALDQIERLQPDVVICELDLPDGEGIRLIRADQPWHARYITSPSVHPTTELRTSLNAQTMYCATLWSWGCV